MACIPSSKGTRSGSLTHDTMIPAKPDLAQVVLAAVDGALRGAGPDVMILAASSAVQRP